MNIIERLYELTEDIEWHTGIPIVPILTALSITISIAAIIISLT